MVYSTKQGSGVLGTQEQPLEAVTFEATIEHAQNSILSFIAKIRTRSGRSLPMAFVVGGLICVVGQALTQCYLSLGLGREEAGAWCSVTLIFLSVLTTGLGWYQRLAKYAGAGTLVPITGFANAMSSPAIEFKSEGMVLGLAAKLFVIAGPVIVYGTVASVLYGLVLVIFGMG